MADCHGYIFRYVCDFDDDDSMIDGCPDKVSWQRLLLMRTFASYYLLLTFCTYITTSMSY